MKYLTLIGGFILVSLCGLFGSCKEETISEPKSGRISGAVQKGPFITGTAITIQPLDDRLNPIGSTYQTQIIDDKGTFALNSMVEAPYVELIAHGYYFNEVSGELSASELTLRSIGKPFDADNNINMLTTLAAARIRKLLVEEHKSYEQAQEIAQTEVLACFGISLSEPIAAARMDISRTGEANAALLAISAVMQDRRTEAELSELMAAISNDIRDNGRITVPALKEELLVSGIEIEPDEIRQNLIDRYAELGLKDAEVPDFYDFVDSDGDGELNGANPYLIVSYRQTIGNEGGELDVKVRSNQDWDVVVPAEAEAWLRVVRSSRADNRLTLGVEPNQGAPRTAKIEIRHRNGAMTRYVELTQAGAQVSMRVRLVDALAVGSNSELSLDQVADLVLMGFDEQGRMLFNQAIERISETTLSVAVILPPEQLEERINMTLYTVANDFDTYKDFRGTEDELKTLRSQRNLNQGALPMPRIDVQRYTLLYGRDNPITVPLKLAVAQVQVRLTFDETEFETEPEVLEVMFTGINDRNGFLFPVSEPEESDRTYRYDYSVGAEPENLYLFYVYRMTSLDKVQIKARYAGEEYTYYADLTNSLYVGDFHAGTAYSYTIRINKKIVRSL